MTDYIGKYVKKFESGTQGSLALGSCGYDWGLSCGSYQLTLRWGNCISFLKKYFPSESAALYFNSNMKDIGVKTWPGSDYCSSPDAVKGVWRLCYNKVGADKFFEYEHAWIEANYYVPIKKKIRDILDLDTFDDRAYRECFWSWAVNKGSGGANTAFRQILKDNNITSLDYVDREWLFDLIYDKRKGTSTLNRYKKGVTNGSSERETLRPLLGKGTFSGKTKPVEEPKPPVSDTPVTESSGSDTTTVYYVQVGAFSSKGNADSLVSKLAAKGFTAKVAIEKNMYKVRIGSYANKADANTVMTKVKANKFDAILVTVKEEVSKPTLPYRIRVRLNKGTSIIIRKDAASSSKTAGSITSDGVFTIVDEKNGFAKLKSGAGWVDLNSSYITKMN